MADSAQGARRVHIPDHLWDVLETMAQEMGSERDALLSQAVFNFARLNGYVTPGQVARGAKGEAASAEEPPARAPEPVRPQPEPALRVDPVKGDEPLRSPPRVEPPRVAMAIGRIRPTEPEGAPPRSPTPTPIPAAEPESPRRGVADRVLETAAQLEKLMSRPSSKDPEPAPGQLLFLAGDDGKLDRVAKERYLIGRGKHCDMVINSGKVSREHAAILSENGEWFIEDLGSSNGTWFNKQRIKRRKIEDGDEYFVCSEKLRCVFRAGG